MLEWISNSNIDSMDKELLKAMLNPITIDNSSMHIRKANNDVTVSLLMIDNFNMQIPNVRKQLNLVLPKEIIQNKNPYTVNMVRDINMYRKFYEKQAKEINLVIENTKTQVKQIYDPLANLKDKLGEYTDEFEKAINQLIVPLENKRDGLNTINTSLYSEENIKNFSIDKDRVVNEINEFIKLCNSYFDQYSQINKDNMNQIDHSLNKFNCLIKPAKELSIYIEEAFVDFENAILTLTDITNKEKIDQTFQNIKQKIENFCARKIKVMEDMGNEMPDIIGIKSEEYEQIKNKMDQICEELRNKSDNINQNIADIREKYDESKLQLKVVEMPKVHNAFKEEMKDINEGISKAEKAMEETKKEQKESIEKDKEKIQNQSRFDLLFIIDITSSMDVYLDEVKKDLLDIIGEIQNKCAGVDIHLGFIGYRDINDLLIGNEYVDLDFTSEYESIKKNIELVEADGGGDFPEDLCGAFEMAKNKSWGGNSRFAILVTDSPCHGSKYQVPDETQKDNYPDGDPDGRNIEDYVSFFAKNQINYFCLKITSATDKMFKIFSEIYEKNVPQGSKAKFIVEETTKKIKEIVVNRVTQIYRKREKVDFEDEEDHK